MAIKKIEINAEGSYKILLEDGRYVGRGQIFSKDADLKDVNPVIVKAMKDAVLIEYEAPTFEQNKINKATLIRNAMQGQTFSYNDGENVTNIFPSDVKEKVMLAVGANDNQSDGLPQVMANGYVVDTIQKIKGITKEYNKNDKMWNGKLVSVLKAETQAQLDAVII